MVMHARKTQRMNDGYFEKHQAHPYQNSKYGSSKSYGSTSDRYERIRDSPNGNYRSDSPDSQSPRDRERSYQSKGSYLQKIREKERENRDYKMSRDKFSDCARSPKEKRSRESEHRTNNDRNEEKSILHPIKMSQNLSSRDRKPVHNNSVDKRDERERVPRVGDWSEHVSSSGKKYYYNCKTEVSQWEKPREWIERERDRFRGRDRDRDRDSDRNYSRSGARHDKHSSNSRSANSSSSSSKDVRESATGSRHWSSGSNREIDSDAPCRGSGSRRQEHLQPGAGGVAQDMDISPGDSTPTSELSCGNSTQTSAFVTSSTSSEHVGPVLLANALPRLMSHHVMPPSTPSNRSETSPQCSTPSNVPQASITISNAPGPPLPRMMTSSTTTMTTSTTVAPPSTTTTGDLLHVSDKCLHGLLQQQSNLSVDTNNLGGGGGGGGGGMAVVGEGPPTPTHSETPDCTKAVAVPVSSPSGNLSTLQGMSSSLQALRPQGPSITPSLANHYRDDLVNHVRGWPAEILEKQAQKLADEAHIMGSIQCSKVSAELKSARSIVRLTEIQATLQEQRILFLRQQIKELEELKSQNSFMSDDS